MLGELGGGLQINHYHQVARGFPPQTRQTEMRYAEGCPGLGTRRNVEAGLGGQGRDNDFGAQRGLSKRELRPVIKVLALAGEGWMGGNVDFQIEVPWRGTPGPGFPFPLETQAGTSIHPRRDAHLNLLFFFDYPAALTY